MRKIVHISDVHFGTADPRLAQAAVEKINALEPDIVVCSGDLTQRAKTEQFREARAFLDQLPQPQIVVPGNHDVPLWNVFDRFFRPLEKYKKFITADLSPNYEDDELAIVGINTARSLVIKGGRINEEQIAEIRDRFCSLDDAVLKVVVTHHPFELPENSHHDDVVGRAEIAMPLIADCGGDVFLAGHLHVSHIETTAKRYKIKDGHLALVIQAGTATSVRVRGEVNSFNLIEWNSPRLRIDRFECERADGGFQPAEHKLYAQGPRGWEKLEG
jgi:3',5'-cyclic AMP phosphodiesterase CpdA